MSPDDETYAFPVSFAQQRLFFLDQLHPRNPAYNLPTLFRIDGALDARVLEAALNHVVMRHEVLRTTYGLAEDGNPVQIVHPYRPFALPAEDLTALDDAARERVAREKAREEATAPFDLATGPVFRVRLLSLADDAHWLAFTVHHIAFDGWSVGLLRTEITQAYADLMVGREPSIPHLPIQYADYALWQRDLLEAGGFEKDLAYWEGRLEGASPLELPADFRRPPEQTFRGDRRTFRVPQEVSDRLKSLASGEGATPFMALLAATQAFLSRYTGQEDVSIGTPVAGRGSPETASVMGFFVNTLVMRGDMSGDPTFRELLARTRAGCLEAYAHQDLPFDILVSRLQVDRDPSRTPLFQVMLSMEPAPGAAVSGELALHPLDPEGDTAKFDLTFSFRDGPRGIEGSVEFNTDLYAGATVTRLVANLQRFLQGVAEAPDERLSTQPLLAVEEERQVLHAWNATAAAVPAQCVHETFEAHALRAPDRIAVAWPGGSLTYGELEARASRLAARLVGLGVGRDVVVGVLCERSPDLLVGILAVLKAGGAYLPLDPNYPRERLAFMLEDAKAPILLAHQATRDVIPVTGAQVVRIDAPDETAAPMAPPGAPAKPGDLAYVIYTSGSTGTPKGVCIEHRSLANLVAWHVRTYRLTSEDRASHLAGLSFDAAVWEVWPPLTVGASVHLPHEEARLDPEALVDWIREEGITTAFAPTPLAERLLAVRWPRDACLRVLLTGGDRLTRAPSPGTPFTLVNHYGPTEATVVATAAPVPPETLERAPPIGRPIANTRTYVLDAHRRPVPIGVQGEVYVAGVGVARGYLHRPELTAERFLPDPFHPGERMYRTGDLARWLADGQLEFLGRTDHQVKVRGFRIELGEIESALASAPGVTEAAVIVREDAPGDRRLVGYVVGPHADAGPLRAHLQRTLPDHMVPSAFVALDELPLTPNGKVDRKALPAPHVMGDASQAGDTEPKGDTEALLATLWKDLLRVPTVGRHDNFFALGGDSILSIQVVARARQHGLHLSPRDLFKHQTLAGLASAARSHGDAAPAPLPSMAGEAPLTPIQRWFFEQPTPDPSHFNQATLLRLHEDVDAARVAKALQHVAARHEALRLRFRHDHEGRWTQTQGPASEGAMPFRVVDLAHLPAPSAWTVALTEESERVQRSLDIAQGPMGQAVLFHLPPGNGHRLLLVLHHLVVDGVSWRILLEDLELAYSQLAQGIEVPSLPSGTTPFSAWARALSEDAGGSEALVEEAPYWEAQSALPAPPFRVDNPDGANTVASATTLAVALTRAETDALLRDAHAAYRTQVNDVLLTALARAVARWSGNDTLQVDLEGHGREDVVAGADLTRTVGWFTSMYPVRLRLPPAGDAGACLKAVKEQLRAVPRRGIGYGLLRYLSTSPAAARLRDAPASPVSFNYLGQFDTPAREGALVAGFADELTGSVHAPEAPRPRALDIGGAVADGRLRMTFTASVNQYPEAALQDLADAFLSELREILAYCTTPGPGGRTPSDFPLARLDQATLDRLLPPDVSDVEDLYPLSPMQEGMLYHSLAEPDTGVYLEQVSFVLDGPLDATAFEQAWRDTVARHPILRTSFHWEGLPRPMQMVHTRVDVPFQAFDWSGIPASEQAERLDAFLREDRALEFALTRAPLLRLALLRLGPSTHRLVWSFHHLLLDGWSIPLVLRDVIDRHHAITGAAKDTAPPAAPRPYVDHIAWLEAQNRRVAEAYWRDALRDFTAPTPLAFGTAPAGSGSGTGEVEAFLTEAETQRLVSFTRDARLTMSTLAQGAWALLLAETSARPEVVFGATVSGRPSAIDGVEDMVGLFINTLPVRVPLPRDATVTDWLHALQARNAEAAQYEHTPLVLAQAWSAVPAGSPLFESLVVFENYPTTAAGDGSGAITLRDFTGSERTNFPVTLVVGPGERLGLKLAYDRGRFTGDALARALGRLREILLGLVAEGGGAPLSRVSPGLVQATSTHPVPVRLPPPGDRAHVPPRTAIEAVLAKVWATVLGVPRVGVHDDFFDLGGHSLTALRVASECTAQGVPLRPRHLFQHRTIATLAAALEAPEAAFRSLVPLRSEGAEVPLFLVHPAGGSVAAYAVLAGHLPLGIPLYGFQAAGSDDDREPDARVAGMARAYLAEMRALQPSGPYRLGGWSLGALVALEMARHLEAAGEEVALLALLDPADPTARPSGPETSPALEEARSLLERLAEGRPGDDEPVRVALRTALARTGLPPGLAEEAPEVVRRALRVLVAHREALREHHAIPARCPTLLVVSEETLKAAPHLPDAWRALVPSFQGPVVAPGDHWTFLTDPAGVRAVAEALTSALSPKGAGTEVTPHEA